MQGLLVRFQADEESVSSKYDLRYSLDDLTRRGQVYDEYLSELAKTDFDHLSEDGQLDYVLLRHVLEDREAELQRDEQNVQKLEPLIPFAATINNLEVDRRNAAPMDHEAVANQLAALAKQIGDTEQTVRKEKNLDKLQAYRALQAMGGLERTLDTWNRFYTGYDPLFDWWMPQPYKAATAALESYRKYLSETVLGIKEGDPANAMVDYTPEEFIAIANKEYAWCEAEMKKASQAMGCGDDWKKALAKVRTEHVQPGEEPLLIKQMSDEAVAYVTKHNLVTVPPLADESWTMEMMSPRRQLVTPFFTGGRTIDVSFPTSDMTEEQKEVSLRANNRYFDRATVFHELIPGHRLQEYMQDRYHPYRSNLENNPFWIEGWAFYWEMLLYDMGFMAKPEERVGSLFWRMHRCARIVFSLEFQLGQWTPQQCVDYLVDKVGHERITAEGEVRRSIIGSYGPTYQLAYMVGALEFRQLHRDLVDTGKMSAKEFHDTILKGNEMPIELVRAMLTHQKLTRDYKTQWRFYPLETKS